MHMVTSARALPLLSFITTLKPGRIIIVIFWVEPCWTFQSLASPVVVCIPEKHPDSYRRSFRPGARHGQLLRLLPGAIQQKTTVSFCIMSRIVVNAIYCVEPANKKDTHRDTIGATKSTNQSDNDMNTHEHTHQKSWDWCSNPGHPLSDMSGSSWPYGHGVSWRCSSSERSG